MKQGDIILYGCVIIGAGVGLVFDAVFPGVLIGLGVGGAVCEWMGEEVCRDYNRAI